MRALRFDGHTARIVDMPEPEPTADLGLEKRLHRIRVPTLLLWGGEDRVVPPSYAKRFAARISGWVDVRSLEGAGHVAEIDQPEAAAQAVLRFLS